MMGYEFDILRLLAEIIRLLVAHPAGTGVLGLLVFFAGLLQKAVRFVLSIAVNSILSHFFTERILKRLIPPSENPGPPEGRLSRELGRREAAEESPHKELERERRRAARLEAELRKARRP